MKRIGIDVGGTFTDVVLLDDADGRVWTAKVPTTPADPVEGALNGIARILQVSGAQGREIGFIGHGTTIATNLLVEGKGARTALVTTKGFRDILEIRKVSRHDRADLYDLFFTNPPPLVPRALRREVPERVLFNGEVAEPLTSAEAEAIADGLESEKVEAVAICFINSHANPAHERQMLETLRRRLDGRFVTASCDVNPEMFEYERTSTTVINAMLGPKCGRYFRTFRDRVSEAGVPGEVLFMQSNGGLAKPAVAALRPVSLLESGPAGGVTAAAKLCQRLGLANAITGDMGGTTFDVSLVRDGRAEMRNIALLHSYAVRFPTIDIESIGAGGGSIAWVDDGGGVHVGPQSAGADPGPACYGRGGANPTVTDCNLILGYLDAESFLSGEFALDVDAAHRVVESKLARPLGCGLVEAAQIVRAVANALMAQAIRLMTVERGYDPREFAYVCYGGAGPVHAIELAQELEIPTVVVPQMPGLFSAFGMLVADQTYDLQLPVLRNLDDIAADDLAGRIRQLETQAASLFREAGIAPGGVALRRRADCRYLGQAESLTIDVPDGAVTADTAPTLARSFEAEHRRHWNFTQPDRPVSLVNLRLQAVVATPGRKLAGAGERASGAPKPYRQRSITIAGSPVRLPAYRRHDLRFGHELMGPAVIEEPSSSLVFPAGWRAAVDGEQNLIVKQVG